MTNDDKIIQLFEAGQFELAYALRKGLNISIDYSKIDLINMVHNLGIDSTLQFKSNYGNVIEVEINGCTIDWIEIQHYDYYYLMNHRHVVSSKFNIDSIKTRDAHWAVDCYEVSLFFNSETPESNIPKALKYIFEYEGEQ